MYSHWPGFVVWSLRVRNGSQPVEEITLHPHVVLEKPPSAGRLKLGALNLRRTRTQVVDGDRIRVHDNDVGESPSPCGRLAQSCALAYQDGLVGFKAPLVSALFGS